MKNKLFDATDLYIMLRLSYLKRFPNSAHNLRIDETLTTYLQEHHNLRFTIENNEVVRGLSFSGTDYEMHKDEIMDTEPNLYSNKGSALWYLMQVMKFRTTELGELQIDLDLMRIWLTDNGYIKEERPTDKFLREPRLIIGTY